MVTDGGLDAIKHERMVAQFPQLYNYVVEVLFLELPFVVIHD